MATNSHNIIPKYADNNLQKVLTERSKSAKNRTNIKYVKNGRPNGAIPSIA